MSEGLFSAKDVVILWGETETNCLVTEVVVTLHEKERAPGLYRPIEYLEEAAALCRLGDDMQERLERGLRALRDDEAFPNSRGRIEAEWMNDPRATPEAVFMSMLGQGFADRMWFERAVEEFAVIKECGWARKLLAAHWPEELRGSKSPARIVDAYESEVSLIVGCRGCGKPDGIT